jgi:hypothetical protein
MNDNAALELFRTQPQELKRELRYTLGLYPALVRAIRLATENNHDVLYEYFILGMILDETTRAKFVPRGYDLDVLHSWCHARIGQFPPAAIKKQLPEFARFSEGLTEWLTATQIVVREKRVPEHQTLTLEDFLDAVARGRNLQGSFHLPRIQELLQQSERPARLPPLSEVVRNGFSNLDHKSNTILHEVREFRGETGEDLRDARSQRIAIKSDTEAIKKDTELIQALSLDIKRQTNRIEEMLPPIMAVSWTTLTVSILGAIGLGSAAGLLFRLYFGVL